MPNPCPNVSAQALGGCFLIKPLPLTLSPILNTPMTDIAELCKTLLIAAAQFSGYEIPERCPELIFVPVGQLRKYVCPGQECPVHGLYIYGRNELLIDDRQDLKDLDTRAIIVHELVHFLQDRVGETADTSCEAAILR